MISKKATRRGQGPMDMPHTLLPTVLMNLSEYVFKISTTNIDTID